MSTTTDSLKDLLCRDGFAEFIAKSEFEAEPRGEKLFEVRLAGDSAKFERETVRQHWLTCPGCLRCWPESLERESDI
jgi:hypothetical protein